jgi:hypothetical protein
MYIHSILIIICNIEKSKRQDWFCYTSNTRKTMVIKENNLSRRSATDAVERLNKWSLAESVKAKGHLSPTEERVGISKRLFGSLHPAEHDLVLEFPVIEWDSDDEDESDHSSDSEGGNEALCHGAAAEELHEPSPITTAVRPRRLSYPQALVMSRGREFGLVRSKAFVSHLSLLDSRDSRKPSLHGGRVP